MAELTEHQRYLLGRINKVARYGTGCPEFVAKKYGWVDELNQLADLKLVEVIENQYGISWKITRNGKKQL